MPRKTGRWRTCSAACRSSAARCTARSRPSARRSRALRVAYVQVAGGALPLQLSDTLRALQARALIATTVSAGACFGGDVECVTAASAFAWAAAGGFEAVVCAIGPGIVGTASRLGHGGLAAADAAERGRGARRRPGARSPRLERRRAGNATGAFHTTRARSPSSVFGEVAMAWPAGLDAPGLACWPARGRCRGMARGVRKPPARAHGPRPG